MRLAASPLAMCMMLNDRRLPVAIGIEALTPTTCSPPVSVLNQSQRFNQSINQNQNPQRKSHTRAHEKPHPSSTTRATNPASQMRVEGYERIERVTAQVGTELIRHQRMKDSVGVCVAC